MSYDDWITAMKPKAQGSWNLHKLLPNDMEFFIFLSSATGVIGNRGQANYNAGNCFEDALARHRSANGMSSVSLDLGPILGAGMVAENEATMDILRSSGFLGIRLKDFRFILERAISGYGVMDERMPPQVVMGVGTGGLVQQRKPADPFWTRTKLFAFLNQVDLTPELAGSEDKSTTPGEDLRPLLQAVTDVEAAAEIICESLVKMLRTMLGISSEVVVDPNKTPSDYGSDSLRAVGIVSWIRRATGVETSVLMVNSQYTILQIAQKTAEQGGFGAAAEAMDTT
jgi:hypothetical protein